MLVQQSLSQNHCPSSTQARRLQLGPAHFTISPGLAEFSQFELPQPSSSEPWSAIFSIVICGYHMPLGLSTSRTQYAWCYITLSHWDGLIKQLAFSFWWSHLRVIGEWEVLGLVSPLSHYEFLDLHLISQRSHQSGCLYQPSHGRDHCSLVSSVRSAAEQWRMGIDDRILDVLDAICGYCCALYPPGPNPALKAPNWKCNNIKNSNIKLHGPSKSKSKQKKPWPPIFLLSLPTLHHPITPVCDILIMSPSCHRMWWTRLNRNYNSMYM